MKHHSIAVVLLAAATIALGSSALTASAETLTSSFTPFSITNKTSGNAISITQTGDVGDSRARSGAVFVDNTGNDRTGLTLYTNAGASVAQPLMRLEVDNPAFDEEILYIHSDSPTSRGLIRLDSPAPEIEFVETDQVGAAGKFEVRVQHDTFQINSRLADDSGFENKITMTHDGDLELRKGTLKVEGKEAAEFAGGINVTGGCIAIDGTCVSLSGTSAPKREASAPASSAAVKLVTGKPDDLSCNSNTERGALALDVKENRLYVCNGIERGWDSVSLAD